MIDNLTRVEILKQMPKGGVCAEIGVWKGDFAQVILDVLQPEKLFLIDPWKAQEYDGAWYNRSQDEMDEIRADVMKRFALEIVRNKVELLQMYSANASWLFDNNSLDFVYIDGCHLYKFIKNDLKMFWPKLKSGGRMMGDDYDIEGWWEHGVTKAVDGFNPPDIISKKIIKDQFIFRRK
jgi:hypothetical protein